MCLRVEPNSELLNALLFSAASRKPRGDWPLSQEHFIGLEIQCHGNPAPGASVPKENASDAPSLFLGVVFTGPPPSQVIRVVMLLYSLASLHVVYCAKD